MQTSSRAESVIEMPRKLRLSAKKNQERKKQAKKVGIHVI